MLKRPGSLLAVDPTTHLNADTGEVVDLEAIQNTDEQDREHEKARDGGIENAEEVQCDPREAHLRTRAMPKPCLSNCRTHNDQLIVGTCGTILARRTFYNAESVSAAVVSR